MQAADVLDDIDGDGGVDGDCSDSISIFDDDEYYVHIATLADDECEARDNLESLIDNDNENDFLDRMNLPPVHVANNNNNRNNGTGARAAQEQAQAVVDEADADAVVDRDQGIHNGPGARVARAAQVVVDHEADADAVPVVSPNHATMQSASSLLATIILVLLEVDETSKPMEMFYESNNKVFQEAHVDEGVHCFLHYILKRYYFRVPAAATVDSTGDAAAGVNHDVQDQVANAEQSGRERCSKDIEEEEEEPLPVAGGVALSSAIKSHNAKPINNNVNDSEEEKEEPTETQTQNDANTHTTHSHNYLVHGVFDSFECLEQYMRRKYCAENFEFWVREYFSSFPMLSMWHRWIVDSPREEETEYNKANHKGPMGFFFVKKVHYLSEDNTCPRMIILDALCHMASLAIYGTQEEESKRGDNDNNLETDTATDVPVLSGGCVSYDVLVSNDVVDRFGEVIEWSSWTSQEHYVCHMDHALLSTDTGAAKVRECHALINSYTQRPSEISYWERVPEMPFLS
jgi:hypothetical protein